MCSEQETKKVTPEKEKETAAAQEQAWWASVKYPDPPRESER